MYQHSSALQGSQQKLEVYAVKEKLTFRNKSHMLY